MRKVTILFNPMSGQRNRGADRLKDVEVALAVLRSAGVDADASATRGQGLAAEQVGDAIRAGCDVILAAGGDGTVHDVLQGFAEAPENVALGVLPFGTANSLGNELRIPRDAARAAQLALTATRRRVSVGEIQYRSCSGEMSMRLFSVVFGAGLDAAVFRTLRAEDKRWLGKYAYYAIAAKVWLTHPYSRFAVEWTDPFGNTRQEEVTQVLVARIGNFGGMLGRLVPGVSLGGEMLRAVLFKTKSRVRYAQYVLNATWFHHGLKIPGIEVVDTTHLRCQRIAGQSGEDGHSGVWMEADGELLGTLPAEVCIAAQRVTLLVPSRTR